jgi:hypothetical protein
MNQSAEILSEKHELSVMIFYQILSAVLFDYTWRLDRPCYFAQYSKIHNICIHSDQQKILTIKIDYNLLYTQKLSSVKCCLIEMILKNLK